jgi:hypothetical protein
MRSEQENLKSGITYGLVVFLVLMSLVGVVVLMGEEPDMVAVWITVKLIPIMSGFSFFLGSQYREEEKEVS